MLETIEASLQKALKNLKLDKLTFGLEHPAQMEHGDYACNVAMTGYSQLKTKDSKLKYKNPRGLAEAIVAQLKGDENLKKIASEISVAGPGFINISIKKEALINLAKKLLKGDKIKVGHSSYAGKKVMVEYAHPNTHKEMHIGHMRTLIVGEALVRLFKAAGAKVFRANYQGDIGPHVAKSIWGTEQILQERKLSWEQAEKLSLTEKAHLLGDGYVRGNLKYAENKKIIDELNLKLYCQDKSIKKIYQQTRRWSLDYYDQLYRRFGTKFDQLFFESEMAEPGKKIVEQNLGKVFEKSEGAIIFNGEKYGLHKRVFVTKEGNPTYEAKEMALGPAQYKAFPFDKNIHVVANEQSGYFQVVFKALELIDQKFKDKEYHLAMGMVNLVGKKMSSRTGEIVTVDDLLEEVKRLLRPLIKKENLSKKEVEEIAEKGTLGAVKYSVLKTDCQQNVAFDPKQSINLEGNSGPYLQYTFARCESVLHNSKLKTEDSIPKSPFNNEELAILRTVYQFPEIVTKAAEAMAPNQVAIFLYDLAQKFNLFYNRHRILQAKTKDQRNLRLLLTEVTAKVLKQGLNLLGISCPERM
jgi:arginyl-tRNA synthetase